ncbi:MAG: hypothetical protein U0414_10125 [Polyangiaceae bacterium]
MSSVPSLWIVAGLLSLSGCASPGPTATPKSTEDPTAPKSSEVAVTPSTPASSPPKNAPAEIAEADPVHPGYVSFTGMITPAKDGFSVRGVVVTEKLRDQIRSVVDVLPKDPDWFIGAKVKLTGKVAQHDDDPRGPGLAGGPGGIVSQGHDGAWMSLDVIDRIELVALPVVVEGELTRSKGLFALDPCTETPHEKGAPPTRPCSYLVSRGDLAWSLVGSGGGNEGDRVRLFGQPRLVVCDPRDPCLTGGTIPMFDVGRAEKL